MGKNWSHADSLADRMQKYSELQKSGCIYWTGTIESTGYGSVRFQGKRLKAHRAAWIACYGDIPNGILVLHKCDNKCCINPEHLWLGSQKDNMRDMIQKGRKVVHSGEDHWGAKLTEDDVRYIRDQVSNGAKKQSQLADEFGMRLQSINDIVRGKIWKHIL